jgi:hypothetical protein
MFPDKAASSTCEVVLLDDGHPPPGGGETSSGGDTANASADDNGSTRAIHSSHLIQQVSPLCTFGGALRVIKKMRAAHVRASAVSVMT